MTHSVAIAWSIEAARGREPVLSVPLSLGARCSPIGPCVLLVSEGGELERLEPLPSARGAA
jgi:hypothetical protein